MLGTPGLTLASWALAGWLGGVHCLGMCGGLTAALSFNLPAKGPRWPFLLLANLGRIFSYVLIGVLLGGLAASVAWLPMAAHLQSLLYLVSLLLVAMMGCYLAGFANWFTRIEWLGRIFWKRLNPWLNRILPIRRLPSAFLAGALWGWLPCGLVYTAAVGALASASPLQGGLIMLSFGLGTLPNLLSMGLAATVLDRWRMRRGVRQAAGAILLLYACVEIGLWLSK